MKILNVITVVMIATILISSCSKEDDNEAKNDFTSQNDNFIRAKVDGVNYEVTGAKIYLFKGVNSFVIKFDESFASTGIDINMAGEPTVKTYNLNSNNFVTVGRIVYKSPDVYSSGFCDTSSGTLKITSKNGNTIEGTFSFTGKRLGYCDQLAKTITDGTFKATFL